MKIVAFILLSLAVAAAGFLAWRTWSPMGQKMDPTPPTAPDRILRVYTWDDYIDPALIDEFTREAECQLIIDTFDNNEELLDTILSGSEEYDVLVPSTYMATNLRDRGLLLDLDHESLPNLRHVDRNYLKRFARDKTMAFSVPYMVSPTGIGLLQDVSEPSWSLLLDTRYRGKLSVLKDMRETLGAALKAGGHSLNSSEPEEITQAKDLVLSWLANGATLNSYNFEAELAAARIQIAHGYAGDILQARDSNPNLRFAFPREGYSVAGDDLVIYRYTAQTGLAHRFIDFLCRPEIAARNMTWIRFRAPNPEAMKLLDEETRLHPAVNFLDTAPETAEVIASVGEANHLYQAAWQEILAAAPPAPVPQARPAPPLRALHAWDKPAVIPYTNDPVPLTIAYVGGVSDDFDRFHFLTLDHFLKAINRSQLRYQYQLERFDTQRDPEQVIAVYESLAARNADDDSNNDVVLVIDNIWGSHIRAAQPIIQQAQLPLIALNADRNRLDFGESSLFLGSGDQIPSRIAKFIRDALDTREILFLTESGYALTEVYRSVLDEHDLRITREILLSGDGSEPPTRGELEEVKQQLAQHYAALPPGTRQVVLVNAHGAWGNELIRWFDKRARNTSVVGHPSMISGNRDLEFGRDSSNELILSSFSTRDVPTFIFEAFRTLKRKHPNVYERSHATYFIRRCALTCDWVQTLTNSRLGLRRPLSQYDFARELANLRSNNLPSRLGLLRFLDTGEEAPNPHFVVYRNGREFSHRKQLNSDGTVVSNLQIAIEDLRIKRLNLENGFFDAEFSCWTRSDTDFVEGPVMRRLQQRRAADLRAGLGARSATLDGLLDFSNMRPADSYITKVVEREEGNTIYKRYRIKGSFAADLKNVGEFPFDDHLVRLEIQSLVPSRHLSVTATDSRIMDSRGGSGDPGTWQIQNMYQVVDNIVTEDDPLASSERNEVFDQFKSLGILIETKRSIWNPLVVIILPITMLGIAGISVLYLNEPRSDEVSEALQTDDSKRGKTLAELSLGIVLAVVAFSFSYAQAVPRGSFVTLADALFAFTLLICVANFIFVVALNHRQGMMSRFSSLVFYRAIATVLYLLFCTLWWVAGYWLGFSII